MAKNIPLFFERLPFERPQINLSKPVTFRMWVISFCAFLVVLQSSLTDSFYSLLIAICAVLAALLTDFLFLFKAGRPWAIKDGSAIASALVLTILLPNNIMPGFAALGAVFAMAVVKHGFGGLGSNWLNPAAAGWLFVRVSWQDAFSELSAPHFFHPLVYHPDGLGAFVGNLTGFWNWSGYLDILASPLPGTIAGRGGLALIVGAIIIIATRVSRFWITAIYLAVFGFLVNQAAPLDGPQWNSDVFFAIFSGGTLAAALFLACDPASSAKSLGGKVIAAMVMAAMAFLFRFYGGDLYGAFVAVLFVNAILPWGRVLERRILYERSL
jgi:electron transport complex protein RnfD